MLIYGWWINLYMGCESTWLNLVDMECLSMVGLTIAYSQTTYTYLLYKHKRSKITYHFRV